MLGLDLALFAMFCSVLALFMSLSSGHWYFILEILYLNIIFVISWLILSVSVQTCLILSVYYRHVCSCLCRYGHVWSCLCITDMFDLVCFSTDMFDPVCALRCLILSVPVKTCFILTDSGCATTDMFDHVTVRLASSVRSPWPVKYHIFNCCLLVWSENMIFWSSPVLLFENIIFWPLLVSPAGQV